MFSFFCSPSPIETFSGLTAYVTSVFGSSRSPPARAVNEAKEVFTSTFGPSTRVTSPRTRLSSPRNLAVKTFTGCM